jgi:hypothetical protein
MGTSHGNVFTFMTISRWIILRMRNSLYKSCSEDQNTILCSITFSPENQAVYKIMSKYMVENREATNNSAIWCMRTACWVRKATRPQMHTRAHARTQKYVTVIGFHGNSCFAKAPQCYVTRTLPALFLHLLLVRHAHSTSTLVGNMLLIKRYAGVEVFIHTHSCISEEHEFVTLQTLFSASLQHDCTPTLNNFTQELSC